ncbi:multidrug and toxic compound extrusion protein, partial [Haematococcus lacustris]
MSSPGPEVDDEEAPLLHYGRTPATATPLSTASQKNGGALKTRLAGIFSLAVPLVTQNIFGYSLSIISAIAVGWLNDPNVLSAVVLAGSVYNVTGYSLVVGLSAGCDAISAQAFGAGNYLLLGVVLQRAILICWAVSLPVLLLWCHAGSLLAALHQAPEISAGAARYLLLASPSLFITAVSGNIQRYLLAQQVVQPSTICTAITALLCPLYNW